MKQFIKKLNTEIQQYLKSDNDWFKTTFEIDEAKDYSEFRKIVSDFCENILTPEFHKRICAVDRLSFRGDSSYIDIYFKFIQSEKTPKQVVSIDGVYTITSF